MSCATRTEAPADFAIENVNIIDTRTGTIQRRRTILIADGSIRGITTYDASARASASVVINGAGAYAIPGLWDSHLHLQMHEDHATAQRHAALALSAGITHGRDMGSSIAALGSLHEMQSHHTPDAPAMIAAGPAFWAFELPYGDKRQQIIVENELDADAAVARLANAGSDFIKVYAGFDRERLQHLIQSASRRGLRVSGHPQPGMTMAEQAELGMLTIEHLDFAAFYGCGPDPDRYFNRVIAARFGNSGETIAGVYAEFARSIDRERCVAMIGRAANAGLAFTPTMVTSFLPQAAARNLSERVPPSQRESCELYLRQFDGLGFEDQQALADAGRSLMQLVIEAELPVLAGTDAPLFCAIAGESFAVELELMRDAGLPPLRVLQAATLLPARVLGAERFGSIAADMQADIVLLRANPLEDAAAYRHPIGVFTRGHWLDAEQLQILRQGNTETSSHRDD